MRSRDIRRCALAALALAAVGIAVPVAAGSLRIMPIRVEVAADARFCSLTVANDEDVPVSVQVHGYGWSKDANGVDVLAEDAGFQINPTILTLGGKEERLVRCGLPPARGPGEQSWRLVLDELPRPGPSAGGVRTLLRISVPVFRASPDARPDLVWSIGADGGVPALVIENRGLRHAQVTALELTARPPGQQARIGRSFYILAGGRAEVPLPAGFAGAPEAVRAITPDGPLDLRLRAGP
ncbi:fimbria/pilus periplasmic chaperone [Novosphingobium sp. BL-8A]|uniref:fimbrial biogenesis chaperone n=1 Tax=Novosphingobium sp. BL-8A TaxID=3127639 RepID=UPI003756DC03